jgi:hypothetical protein
MEESKTEKASPSRDGEAFMEFPIDDHQSPTANHLSRGGEAGIRSEMKAHLSLLH